MPTQNTTTNPTRRWQADQPLDPASWIPVTELALHGFGQHGTHDTIDQRISRLTKDLGDEIIYDDIGRPCVARAVARQMFTGRAQRQAEHQARQRALEEKLAAEAAPLHDFVRALQQRPTTGDPHADVLAGHLEDNWDKAATARDELMSGQNIYHPINPEQQP